MNKLSALILLAFSMLWVCGCSGKLSRSQAQHSIQKLLEPHKIGSASGLTRGHVPGLNLPEDDREPSAYFTLDQHKTYGDLSSSKKSSPDSEDYLIDALGKLGYLFVQQEGPKASYAGSIKLQHANSRSVSFTSKAGEKEQSSNNLRYASGFSCYPPADFHQCNVPTLIEQGSGYRITGIVQDDTRAKVNILIPWKLTAFGMQLKPFAASIVSNERQFGDDSKYDLYPALYSWCHFLNSHADKGESPAVILFQKFDDGWRIVDEAGKSENDF